MTNPLRPYQAEAAAQGFHVVQEWGGFYIQHDPGMGKSLTAIALARLLKVRRICVVCPPVAIGVWRREIGKWWPDATRERSDVFFNIVSYDSLYDPLPSDLGAKRRTQGRSRLQDLCDWSPELLVLDEAHYAKSPDSKRTKACMQLARFSIYRVLLSGTPTHNVLDAWAQYRMIAPDEPLFKLTYAQFRNELVVLGGPNGNWPMKDKSTGELRFKPRAREALTEATITYTHVATADMMELAEPVETVVPFQLSTVEQTAYDYMEKRLRADLPDGTEVEAEIILTKLLRLTQIAAGHATNTKGDTVNIGTSRLDTTLGILAERPDQKVVIACRFKRDIQLLRDELNAQGRAVCIIDGSVSPKTRTQLEDWFQRPDTNRSAVMLLQYQAGGTAITLHAAHTLILYTLDLSVIRYRQMLGRIWRLGQKGLCEVIVPVAENTQDEQALAGLKSGDDNRLAKLLLDRLRRR